MAATQYVLWIHYIYFSNFPFLSAKQNGNVTFPYIKTVLHNTWVIGVHRKSTPRLFLDVCPGTLWLWKKHEAVGRVELWKRCNEAAAESNL